MGLVTFSMKITKYEHACLDIEVGGGERLIIDPGDQADSLTDFSNIVAVVVTHVHSDHMDTAKIAQIIAANPEVKIFTVQQVADELKVKNAEVVMPNSGAEIRAFNLQFCGGEHQPVHPSFPKFENLGVLVNDKLYYAGDSFSLPPSNPLALAVPSGGPWMKHQESMDYLRTISPKIAFPIHDGFLNDAGKALSNWLLSGVAKDTSTDYRPLGIGESIEI